MDVAPEADTHVTDEPVENPRYRGRVIFAAVLALIGVGYTVEAFTLPRDNLEGRLGGAGLFPQILGIAMVIGALIALLEDGRAARRAAAAGHVAPENQSNTGLRLALWQALLAAVFILSFGMVTVFISAPVYLIVAMATIVRPVKPIQIAIFVAVALTLMFLLDYYLDAQLP
jgi:tripartite tricarboxylate transporter TctB family protein